MRSVEPSQTYTLSPPNHASLDSLTALVLLDHISFAQFAALDLQQRFALLREDEWEGACRKRFHQICSKLPYGILQLASDKSALREFRPWRTVFTQLLSISESKSYKTLIQATSCVNLWEWVYDDALEVFWGIRPIVHCDLLLANLGSRIPIVFAALAYCEAPYIQEIPYNCNIVVFTIRLFRYTSINPTTARLLLDSPRSNGVINHSLKMSLGNTETVKVLFEGARIRKQIHSGLIRKSCRLGYLDTLKYLLSLHRQGNITLDLNHKKGRPLRLAILYGQVDVIDFLIAQDDVDTSVIATLDHTDLRVSKVCKILAKNAERLPKGTIEFLLTVGTDRDGFTELVRKYLTLPDVHIPTLSVCLRKAIRKGYRDVIEGIVTDGRTMKDRDFYSVITEKTSPDIIEALLKSPQFDSNRTNGALKSMILSSNSESLMTLYFNHPKTMLEESGPNMTFMRCYIRALAARDPDKPERYIRELREILEDAKEQNA